MSKTPVAGEPSAFLREHAERLYAFCAFLSEREDDASELALQALGDFGESHREWLYQEPDAIAAREARIALFQRAWERFGRGSAPLDAVWYGGRDTRPLKAFDEDLLDRWRRAKKEEPKVAHAALARVRRLEFEFRAAVVLRDILGFEDEEAVRILGVRWGVYRHRLHRGRLESVDSLRGTRAEPRTSMAEVPLPGT